MSDEIERLGRELDRLTQENRALAERLDRASASERSWRAVLVALSLTGIFTPLVARAISLGTPAVVEAAGFSLRDRQGTRRAAIEMDEGGSPIVALYDRAGKNLLKLVAKDDGTAGMSVYNRDGPNRVSVGVWEGGKDEGISLFDLNGKPRVGLAAGPSSPVGLTIFDPGGRPALILNTKPGGPTGLAVFDPADGVRATVGVSPEGIAGLTVFDRQGQPAQKTLNP